MKKAKKIFEAAVLAVFAVLVIASPSFAAIDATCVGKGDYADISNKKDDKGATIPCNLKDNKGNALYGKSQAACTRANANASSGTCESDDLNDVIKNIVNAIIFAIGIIAVVMIIIGGINYATSQGDPAKVKKGKDTILYGIIGLVVALLAYAIVNFVLGAING